MIRKLGDCRSGFLVIEQVKPHRHSSQYAGLINFLIVLVEGKCETVRSVRPEDLIHHRLVLNKFTGELLAYIFLAEKMSEICKRSQRLRP